MYTTVVHVIGHTIRPKVLSFQHVHQRPRRVNTAALAQLADALPCDATTREAFTLQETTPAGQK